MQCHAEKLGKKLLGENDHEVEAILRRLDRLTLEEARVTGTTTLNVVYDLLKNMKMAMDGALDFLIDSLLCTKNSLCYLDRSVLMDDIRRALGAFISLSTLLLLTVFAVDLQQVASNMNKFRRMFNPDSIVINDGQYGSLGDELQEKVRRWLSPLDPSINHNTAKDAHHEGSAKWFIHGNTFQRWKVGTGSLLWVHGKRTHIPLSSLHELRPFLTAGSGKSILSCVSL